ncbi:MAG: restriction endonuclease subunit S [Acidobacteria bacterium]|nr:restriction endonuclease subunit S [Acidobacteriota bacterium]
MTGMPPSWRSVTVGDVCEFKYGKSLPEASRSGGAVPVFGSNGEVGRHDEALTTGPTIVIGRKGSFGEVTYSAVACWPIDTTYYVDQTATSEDLRWMTYRLSDLRLNTLNRAAAVPGLNREDAYRQRFLLPPRSEQRRIAEILDKADALRAKRRAALAQLDTLTQAIFLDMFGDPGTNPHMFPSSTIGQVSEQVTDGEHLTPKRTAKGIRLLSARNVRDGWIDFENVDHIPVEEYERIRRRCNPSPGDVLISCSGTIGRVACVEADEPFSLVRSAALVRPIQTTVRSKFLEHYLRTPSLKARMLRRANASSQANLFQSQIRELPVYVPPAPLQDAFVLRAGGVNALKATHRASHAELDTLFASLQHRAFRGEL